MLESLKILAKQCFSARGGIRKDTPVPGADPAANREESRVLRDLERLAVTSPHLLADLGFVEDRRLSGAGLRVWRRGGYVVTMHKGADRADARRADVDGTGRDVVRGAVFRLSE